MHVQLTPSDAVVVGGQVDVSCDIWNWQPERSVFVIWLRRSHDSEMELGTNENVVEHLKDRYRARKELRRPADFTRVSYYLTITGTKRTRCPEYCYTRLYLYLYLYVLRDPCLMRISITSILVDFCTLLLATNFNYSFKTAALATKSIAKFYCNGEVFFCFHRSQIVRLGGDRVSHP